MRVILLATSLAVPLSFVVGLGGAVLATFAMDLVMARLPEGKTPPSVASGVLTETSPDEAHPRLASVVHYLAGGLTGPLFVWMLLVCEALLGESSVLATGLAAVVLYVLMVGFFSVVVLPRSQLAGQRLGTIRRDWAISAGTYLLVLVPIVGGGSALL